MTWGLCQTPQGLVSKFSTNPGNFLFMGQRMIKGYFSGSWILQTYHPNSFHCCPCLGQVMGLLDKTFPLKSKHTSHKSSFGFFQMGFYKFSFYIENIVG